MAVQEHQLPREWLESAPYETAGFWSRLSFSFIQPLLRVGAKRPLLPADLPRLASQDTAHNSTERIWEEWRRSGPEKRRGMRLFGCLYRAHKGAFVVTGLLTLLEGASIVAQPAILAPLISWLDSDDPLSTGLALGAALAAASLVQGVVHHKNFFMTMRLGWHARIGMIGVLHRKLLKVSSARLGGHDPDKSGAQATVLIGADAERFDALAPFLHFGWVAILEFAALVVLLIRQVGYPAGLAAAATVVIMMQITAYFGKKLGERRRVTAEVSDQRVSLTSEVLQAMATVKAYAWEYPFARKITGLREEEHRNIGISQRMKAINLGMQVATSSVAACLTFSIYVAVQGNDLSVSRAYATVALLAALREVVGRHFPRFMETAPEAWVAVCRMEDFLLLPEVRSFASEKIPREMERDGEVVLRIDGASFYWPTNEEVTEGEEDASHPGRTRDEERPLKDDHGVLALNRVHVEAKRGQLTIVNGPVGSGKSALLSAILGELDCDDPSRVSARGAIAYCPQAPWIMSGSLEDNVIFNAECDRSRFEDVLRACALDTDVKQLPDGTATEIGERGVNLSGGQKARVSLARACYADVDLVLLDDPLAAVDPEVASHLFQHCIQDWLLRQCKVAVILVTHQKQFEPYASIVLRLDRGGTTEALLSQVPAEFRASESATTEDMQQLEGPNEDLGIAGSKGKDRMVLVKQEDRALGELKWSTWRGYFRAGGELTFLLVLVLFTVGQASVMVTDFYLKIWVEADDQRDPQLIGIYGMLCGVTILLSFGRSISFFFSTLRASSFLHNAALRSILRAPLYFFTMTPLGRILNRFSSDLNQTDELLAQSLYETLSIGMTSLGAILLGCIVVPWLSLLMPFVIYVFVWVRNYATKSMRELKRMDSINRSPVYTSFASALHGLVAIRAYGRQQQIDEDFQGKLEYGALSWYWWLIANRWIGFWLDMLVTVIVTTLVFLVVGLRDSLNAALAGFALTYILSLSGIFQYMVRMSALVETFMTSTERLLYYSTSIPQEEVDIYDPASEGGIPREDAVRRYEQRVDIAKRMKLAEAQDLEAGGAENGSLDPQPPPNWPSSGEIAINDLKVRYREDLPTVLKGISLHIPAGSKVGVVGRTGSGKSSLLLSLARLNEIEAGGIFIDSVDHQRVSLQRLRRGLAIIPQDPHLFSGSIRFNIDPFEEYTDSDILDALKTVNLSHIGEGGDTDGRANLELDYQVEEAGSNLSHGQRQLLSLARALLRKRKLVLLDEATAAVDFETDALIQEALRSATVIQEATCIIIAHRIQTIIDTDLIVVLDNGQVAEMGAPQDLIERGGVFAAMVNESRTHKGVYMQ